MENANFYIPDELWEQIFLREPVESLIRWKCVCKSWNRIISDKSFIKDYGLHQKISQNTRKYLLLNYCDRELDSDPFNYRDHCQRHRLGLVHYDSRYSAGLIDRKSYNVLEYYNDICFRDCSRCCLEVYGICDGLLCLAVDADYLRRNFPIFLYNPFIRKGKKLIPPRRAAYSILSASLCFGFHDDDYKVLRILAFQNMYEIFIYSLSSDSWKSVKAEINMEDRENLGSVNIWPYPKARLVNGVAYFIQGDRIISYDLDDERIRKMQLPADMSSAAHVIMEEYGESIALIGSTSQFINTSNGVAIGHGVGMWVLKQSDKSNIWEKKFDVKGGGINRHGQILYPAVQAMGGFVSDNELVLRKWKIYGVKKYIHREYFLFNVETGFQKQVPRPREQARGFLQRMNILTESLVLLTETTMPPFPSL